MIQKNGFIGGEYFLWLARSCLDIAMAVSGVYLTTSSPSKNWKGKQ
jgi:hypothetical protein